MEAGQRDLGGAGEEELVLRDLVDLVAVAGEHPGPLERLLADQHRRHHRLVALGADQLDREADQRQLEHHQVALEVGEAGAGEAGGRLHVDQAELGAELEVVARLEVELGRLADLADHHRVLLGHPFRGVGVGDVGQREQRPPQLLVDPLQLLLAATRSSPSARRPAPSARSASSSSPAPLAAPICFESVLRSACASSTVGSSSRRRASSASTSSTPSAGAAPRQRGLDPLGVGADQLSGRARRPPLRARIFWPGRGEVRPPGAGVFGDEFGDLLRLRRRRRCSAA